MRDVGLVAARDDHRRAIAGPHVGQGHYDVALAATKDAMVVVVGAAQRPLVPTRVDGVMPAGAAHGQDTLVDEEPFDVGLLLAAIVAHIVDPAGMVDEPLEGLAGLDAVVQLEAGGGVVVTALRIAIPLAVVQRREGIDRAIEVVHQVWLDGLLQDKVASQIEEKVVQRCWLPGFHGLSMSP